MRGFQVAYSILLFTFQIIINHLTAKEADRIFIYQNLRVISKQGYGMMFLLKLKFFLEIQQGTIKATVLIETILAAFEMNKNTL
ncbi:MAG: hypothetical protein Ct9H300mP6_19380 [Gammaproteobacteria bacterium]|nr:MAG: hypothetical protein Ct9H300mP6_19380 [Gammaproteobacteria bacterium]